mgnify:CR=1 FL=1
MANRDFPLAPTPTPDSSAYFKKQGDLAAKQMANSIGTQGWNEGSQKLKQANKDLARQKLKGKPGYDKNGFPIKKP